MTTNTITAGNATIAGSFGGGNDGTFALTVGPAGSQVVALSISATGQLSTPSAANAPAFSAYQSTAQSLPNITATKLQFQTKEFDTAGAYDNVTNFRFTPQVAGYYQVSGGFQVASTLTTLIVYAYKNGSNTKTLQYGTSSSAALYGSALIYMNGSTDYLELFAVQGAAAQNAATGISSTYFQAFLARSA